MPFNNEFDLGDIAGAIQRARQQRALDEQNVSLERQNEKLDEMNRMLREQQVEQQRLDGLQKCPACLKPVEHNSRLCPTCRSELNWVSVISMRTKQLWKRVALKGEEREVELAFAEELSDWLEKCPRCSKPVGYGSRVCVACRSELNWVSVTSEPDAITWERIALRGEEREAQLALAEELKEALPGIRQGKEREEQHRQRQRLIEIEKEIAEDKRRAMIARFKKAAWAIAIVWLLFIISVIIGIIAEVNFNVNLRVFILDWTSWIMVATGSLVAVTLSFCFSLSHFGISYDDIK